MMPDLIMPRGKICDFVSFEYAPWKNVYFCFIFIVWVHFSQ